LESHMERFRSQRKAAHATPAECVRWFWNVEIGIELLIRAVDRSYLSPGC
jgi:hypothetical protein